MSEPYLGEIATFAFAFAPSNWAMCNGQLLPINQNQALYSLLGTQYGGNGSTTFALPNLQGRCALGFSGTYPQGSSAGEISHALLTTEMPTHTHIPVASSANGLLTSPVSAYPAALARAPYSTSPGGAVVLPSQASGSASAHSNQSPFLVLNFCIALTGIYPTRS